MSSSLCSVQVVAPGIWSPTGSLVDMTDTTMSAVAQLKVYLPDPVRRIDLHDFMMQEIDILINQVRDLRMDIAFHHEQYAKRVTDYETAADRLLHLLVVGAFHSDTARYDQLWARCVDRIAARPRQDSGTTVLLDMQQYPTLLALYAIGLGAAASDRMGSIAQVLGSVTIREGSTGSLVGITKVVLGTLHSEAMKQAFPALERRKTPVSDRLLEVLRPMVSGFVPSDERLEEIFDEVEYLMGITYAAQAGRGWGPLGRAVWRNGWDDRLPGEWIDRHTDVLIEAGLFIDTDHLMKVREGYDDSLKSSPLRF